MKTFPILKTSAKSVQTTRVVCTNFSCSLYRLQPCAAEFTSKLLFILNCHSILHLPCYNLVPRVNKKGLLRLSINMENIVFKPITLEDREIIQKYTLHGASQICDLSFANLYGWSDRYQTSWAIVADSLAIRFQPATHNHPAYLMPVCGCTKEFKTVIHQLNQISLDNGFPLILMGISPTCRDIIDQFSEGIFEYIHDMGAEDYVYLREKMVSLSGKHLQPKRNHINKFEKLYPEYQFEEITDANLEECLALGQDWLEHKEVDSSRLAEQKMIEKCLRHREELGLLTGALRVDGKIIAFSFGSPINQDTFDIHVEKADISYEGAFAMINREFAKRIPEQYTYINREEDLGLEGLRKSKLSYKPALMLIKDVAVLRH